MSVIRCVRMPFLPLPPIRISSIRCSYTMVLALTDTSEALHWGVLSAIFLKFVLFIYHVTTYTHQDLLHPVFIHHGTGPHRHRWGPPLGSAQCYISKVCFIHISCHHLLPSGSPLSGVRTPWSWPSQTPVRPSTGESAVIAPWSPHHGGWRGVASSGRCSPAGIILTLEAPYIWVGLSCMKRYYLYITSTASNGGVCEK